MKTEWDGEKAMRKAVLAAVLLLGSTALVSGCQKITKMVGGEVVVKDSAFPERVYWGDTHLHTSNSVDAFGFGNRLDP